VDIWGPSASDLCCFRQVMTVRLESRKQGRGHGRVPRKPRVLREETGQKMERVKEVMTLREASQYLGISPDTLYKYLGEKSIPAFKLGNRWRFKKDLLDRWMERKSERTELVVRPKRLERSTVKG
jgi:excisionase family DNA binding protein